MTQKEQIMDQVMAMFIAQGIKSVRMDDIARQLSISKRTLYEMFGDKEELLYQCIVRHAKSTEQERAKRFKQADNYLEVMLICLREMADKATVANRIRENLRKFYPKVAEKLSNEFESRSIEQLRQWIELCIDQGLFMPKTDIDISLAILYNTANGVISNRNVWLPEGVAPTQVLISAMIIYIRGMSTVRGVEIINDFCNRHFDNKPFKQTLE